MLYYLVITDTELSYDGYSCDFGIGFFGSMKKAEETAEYYLKNVAGFCEYPCKYRITEKEIPDKKADEIPEYVWVIQGWNENENHDETDIVESQCFASEENADIQLKKMKNEFNRENWVIDCWRIDELHWRRIQPCINEKEEIFLWTWKKR